MEGTKSFSHEQNGIALTSNLLIRMALNLSTHISHGRNQSSHHDGMAQPLHLTCSSEWLCISALISDMEGIESSHHDRMAQPLHLTMEGTNPLTMSEWLWVSSMSLGGSLDLENTKSLSEVLELQRSQWLR